MDFKFLSDFLGIIKSVDDMDVPLMLFVMKQKRQVKVLQNVIPDPSDVSIHADMTRINYYTNFIVDNRYKGLSSSDDFEKIWKTVSGVSMLFLLKVYFEVLRRTIKNVWAKNYQTPKNSHVSF